MSLTGNTDFGLLLLRAYFGCTIAIYHGIVNKLADHVTFTARLTELGMPMPGILALLAGLAQLVGGMLMALGLFARTGAAMALPTVLVALIWVHQGEPWVKKDFALAYAVAFLTIAVAGPGRFTIARLCGRERGVAGTS